MLSLVLVQEAYMPPCTYIIIMLLNSISSSYYAYLNTLCFNRYFKCTYHVYVVHVILLTLLYMLYMNVHTYFYDK